MAEPEWTLVAEVGGSLQADIIVGLFQAQGIPTAAFQEGAGHYAYALTVGSLGKVQIYVPAADLLRAQQLLADYEAGALEKDAFPEISSKEDQDPKP